MANVQKYTAAATGHMAAHYERRRDNNGEYIKYGNQDIDLSRTPLNYNLASDHNGGQAGFIRQRLSEVRCHKRDDVNVMCSWVVTLPKYQRADGSSDPVDQDSVQKLFFERTYRFLADRYGEKNVISAYVHIDEKTPHVHFSFIPCTADKKHCGEKVSAKEVLTKHDLQTFHGDLERHLDSFHDWKFEILNEATKDGNRTVTELKKESALEEVAAAEQKAQEARQDVEQVQISLRQLEIQRQGLEGDIKKLQTKKETLSTAEVEAIKGTKTLTGGLKGVSFAEYEALKATAAKVEKIAKQKAAETARADRADQRVTAVEKKAAEAIKQAQQDRPSIQAQIELAQLKSENIGLKKRVSFLEGAVKTMLDMVKEVVPDLFEKLLAVISPSREESQRERQRRSQDLER